MTSKLDYSTELRDVHANDPEALYNLATWYSHGIYVPENRKKSKHFYNKLLEYVPEVINELPDCIDYVQMCSLVGHYHFNDGEYRMARKHFLNGISYAEKSNSLIEAEKLIKHYRFRNRLSRISKVLND